MQEISDTLKPSQCNCFAVDHVKSSIPWNESWPTKQNLCFRVLPAVMPHTIHRIRYLVDGLGAAM